MESKRVKLHQKLIDEKIAQAMAALKEATQISDDTGIGFNFSVAYGMGGSYRPAPKKMTQERAEALLASGMSAEDDREVYNAKVFLGITTTEEDDLWEESSSDSDYGWVSSSADC